MEFYIKGIAVVHLEHKKGDQKSTHVKTDFNIEVSKNLDESRYLNEEELPTAAGSQALTQCFIQGLVGNIHFAHQQGFRNDAEHLRYIITELERGFASIATAEKSHFTS